MFGRKRQEAAQKVSSVGLGATLQEISRRHKRREALRFEGKVTTYQELEENANRVASGLAALGIQKGDRVAMMLPNIPEFAYSFFGIQKLGAVAVPFNTMYKGREIEFILKDSAARAVICLSNFANLINEIKDKCPDLEHVIVTGQRTLVFIDPDSTVNVQMVCDRSRFADADAAFHTVGSVLVESFKALGVEDAWYNHQGAIRAHGKKLATLLISEIENLFVVNLIAFLAPMDTESLFKIIYVPPEIKDKAIEPMTSVSEESGKAVTIDEFRAVLVSRLADALGVTLEEGKLTRDELIAYEKNRALANRV